MRKAYPVPEDLRLLTEVYCLSYGPAEKSFGGLIASKGLAVVYGEPGAGKTSWLIDRLHAWGGDHVRAEGVPLNVVYIALEGAADVWEWAASHHRDTPLIDGTLDGSVPPANVAVLAPEPGALNLLGDRDALLAWVDSHMPGAWLDSPDGSGHGGVDEGGSWCPRGRPEEDAELLLTTDVLEMPDVIVIDSLSRALAGADENSNAVMSAAVEALEAMREHFGAKVLVVAHHPAAGTSHLRGGSALLGAVDSAVHISRKGAVLTARNKKARGFPDGKGVRYQRTPTVSLDLTGKGGRGRDLFRMVYTELPGTEPVPSGDDAKGTAPAKAKPEPTASPAAVAMQKAAPAAAPAPAAPTHPADALRGRPLALWRALGLTPGGSISRADAAAALLVHACMGDVETRRRTARIGEVFDSVTKRGLMVGEVIRNPG